MPEELAQRVVPGALPPSAPSKTQKKRRKAKGKDDGPAAEDILDIPTPKAAAFIDHAPKSADLAAGAIDETLVAIETTDGAAALDGHKKVGPAAEAVAKKLRNLHKKIQRISTYSSLPPASLNEDQRRTAATLPALELTVKELEEVKKSLETIEADLSKEHHRQLLEQEQASKQRIAEALAAAQIAHAKQTSYLFSLIRIDKSLSSEPMITATNIDPAEREAIAAVCQILLGEENVQKDETIAALLSGTGSVEGVPCERLLRIAVEYLAPVPEPARSPTLTNALNGENGENGVVDDEDTPFVEEEDETATAIPPSVSAASSFHFMQASELEGANFEQGAEWIEKPDESEPLVESVVDEEPPVAPVDHEEDTAQPEPPAEQATFDWAAEGDDSLPAISTLQATFGSGTATPTAAPQSATVDAASVEDAFAAPVNGRSGQDDGFMEARRHPRGTGIRGGGDRGYPERGRGRGGFRGDRGGGGYRGRGGFVNGEGGGWRGGDGEHRGRGGFRGDRGGRGGEFRGRGRGDRGFRGRGGAGPPPESA